MVLRLVCLILFYGTIAQPSAVASSLLPTMGTPFFISKPEAKQKELDDLNKRFEDFKKNPKYQKEKIDQNLETIKNEILQTKESLRLEPDNEFFSKKLVFLNDGYQALRDLSQVVERFVIATNEYAHLLEDYLKDPELKQYYSELGTLNRVAFSFEDLRQIKEKIESKKASIDLLQQQDAHTLTEIKSREQAASALMQQYKEKKDEQRVVDDPLSSSFDLSEKQKRELTNLEYVLLGTKRDIDDLQLQILELRLKKIRVKIEVEKLQLQILQEVFLRIKQSSIRISEADLAFAKDELEKKRQKLNALKIDMYEPKKEDLKQQIAQTKGDLELLSKQYNVPIAEDLNEWLIVSKGTVDSYIAFFIVAKANALLVVERLELEELESQIALQDQTLFLERIANDIKMSFYKIYTGKFASEEKIFEEIKRYEVRLSDIKANLSQLENKKSTIESQLAVAKKAIENIGEKRQELLNQKDRLFKGSASEYGTARELLNTAEELIKKEIKVLNAIQSIYNDTVLKLVKTEQQIRFTIEELRASSRNIIWDRPEDAISWQGIVSAVPNIETFIRDVRSYILHFDLPTLIYKVKAIFHKRYTFINFIITLILWILFLIFAYMTLPWMHKIIAHVRKEKRMNLLTLLFQLVFSFISTYFAVIMGWLSCLLFLNRYRIPDPYPYIIFYLLSIPLLLFLAHRFMRSFLMINIEHEYVLISKEYQRRFALCVSTLLYVTITIFFFREAFILANYPKSELPNILKALNIIMLQVSIIFLLTKELVLNILPRTNDVWIWIRDIVDHYYYGILLVLIAIIVMMNPYVGFGRLVLFVLSRMIYTFILIGVLFWLHGLVKSWSSALFFQSDQDGVKERFPVAKTWYGVSIICILFSFMFIGAIIIAKIWQWPERLKNIKEMGDIIEWLQTPVLFQDTQSPLSVYVVIQFMLFILGGFLVATAIRKFVLSRIFDVLLVDSGVQNTVNSLMRYVIYLIAIMLGLNAIGLSTQINYMITALLVGIGIIIKDPAADFFAYFIILVQRPIKIGDYIRIDDEATGVVRKITPRSVVLRRKNSTMIIVPNSYAVNHTIVNWNYIRGFIAFNDIHVMVSYKEDPMKVKEIFERVLDSSPYVLKNPKPIVRLHEFGPNGYEFLLRGFISSNYTLDQWDIASGIRLQIVKIFKQQNIEFALPIRLMVNYPPTYLKEQVPVPLDINPDDIVE
jgi:small-conductance mechanosensitive channel